MQLMGGYLLSFRRNTVAYLGAGLPEQGIQRRALAGAGGTHQQHIYRTEQLVCFNPMANGIDML